MDRGRRPGASAAAGAWLVVLCSAPVACMRLSTREQGGYELDSASFLDLPGFFFPTCNAHTPISIGLLPTSAVVFSSALSGYINYKIDKIDRNGRMEGKR